MNIDSQKLATSTSRSKGAVGNNPLVYRRFRELVNEVFPRRDLRYSYILDFGAGKDAKHTKALIAEYFPLTFAYDYPENSNTAYHISKLRPGYSVVLASNVLNVQDSEEAFERTLQQITNACFRNSYLVCNFPAEPRHWKELTNAKLLERLEQDFILDDVRGPRNGKGTLVIVARRK